VGRTRLLPLQDRAALAARAQIRHAYTDYEQQLDDHVVSPVGVGAVPAPSQSRR
jgi:hypothetical protein